MAIFEKPETVVVDLDLRPAQRKIKQLQRLAEKLGRTIERAEQRLARLKKAAAARK